MEVGIATSELFVVEGEGVLEVTLMKSQGAVGPVQVRLLTQSGTALGKLLSLN